MTSEKFTCSSCNLQYATLELAVGHALACQEAPQQPYHQCCGRGWTKTTLEQHVRVAHPGRHFNWVGGDLVEGCQHHYSLGLPGVVLSAGVPILVAKRAHQQNTIEVGRFRWYIGPWPVEMETDRGTCWVWH